MQPSLFDPDGHDPAGAAAARDEGIGVADANADAFWKGAARAAIRHCAARQPDGFTADDVLRALAAVGHRTHGMAALGPVFLAAARDGDIVKTGATARSTIRRRHRDLTVWRAP